LEADFNGNMKNYGLNVQINNGIAVYDDQQYQMGRMQIKSKIDTISTDVTIKSDFLNGRLKIERFPCKHQYGYYQTIQKLLCGYLDGTFPLRFGKT